MQRRRHHKSEGCWHTQLRQRKEQIARLRRPDDKAPDDECRIETEGIAQSRGTALLDRHGCRPSSSQ